MKIIALISALIAFTPIYSQVDKHLDLGFITDFNKFKERTHFDINTQLSYEFTDRAIILNPRFSLFLDGTVDLSVATGMRHQTPFGTLGHHVFWDCSTLKEVKFNQLGHSLDLLTDNFDYRINYYHPLVKELFTKKYIYSSHRWFEGEMIWKNDYCHIGAGPKYDLFNKAWGIHAKVLIPFKHVNIGTSISYDRVNNLGGCFSVSFPLFTSPRKKLLHAPIFHRSRVEYSRDTFAIAKKSEEQKNGDEKKQDEKETIAPGVIPAVDPISPADNPPKSPRWFDFFFGTNNQNQG